MLRPFWDDFGTILGSLWDHFGMTLGQFWEDFGIILGRLWDHFGKTLGSFWDNLGIILGMTLGNNYIRILLHAFILGQTRLGPGQTI